MLIPGLWCWMGKGVRIFWYRNYHKKIILQHKHRAETYWKVAGFFFKQKHTNAFEGWNKVEWFRGSSYAEQSILDNLGCLFGTSVYIGSGPVFVTYMRCGWHIQYRFQSKRKSFLYNKVVIEWINSLHQFYINIQSLQYILYKL